jgi:hypothetical protein
MTAYFLLGIGIFFLLLMLIPLDKPGTGLFKK